MNTPLLLYPSWVSKRKCQVLLASVLCLLVLGLSALSFAPSAHAASIPTASVQTNTAGTVCSGWSVASNWTWQTSYGTAGIVKFEDYCVESNGFSYVAAYCEAYDQTIHGYIAHVGIQLEVYNNDSAGGTQSTKHVYPVAVDTDIITDVIAEPASIANPVCFVSIIYS